MGDAPDRTADIARFLFSEECRNLRTEAASRAMLRAVFDRWPDIQIEEGRRAFAIAIELERVENVEKFSIGAMDRWPDKP